MKILALSNTFCKHGVNGKPGQVLKEAGFKIDINQKRTKYLERDLLPIIRNYEAVITGSDEITSSVLSKGKNLKIIAKAGVGYDNIDVKAATENGVYVTFTPGAVEQTVADTTFGYVLDLARNLTFVDRYLQAKTWKRIRGTEVWRKNLGIIGLGRIGKYMAYRARGFDMEVSAYDPYINTDYCKKNNIKIVSLEELFCSSDFICVHCLLNKETRNLVNKDLISLMKPTAFLINTSRGGIVEEHALFEALNKKKIAGAALDVFEKEPLPEDSPLFNLDNLIIGPHNAGQSSEAILKMGMMVSDSVIDALNGKVPKNLLNEELINNIK